MCIHLLYQIYIYNIHTYSTIMQCLEDAKQQVQLPGLSEHHVTTVDELLDMMSRGHSCRSTGATGANATSSRSHQIMQLVVKEYKKEAQVCFISYVCYICLTYML